MRGVHRHQTSRDPLGPASPGLETAAPSPCPEASRTRKQQKRNPVCSGLKKRCPVHGFGDLRFGPCEISELNLAVSLCSVSCCQGYKFLSVVLVHHATHQCIWRHCWLGVLLAQNCFFFQKDTLAANQPSSKCHLALHLATCNNQIALI